VRRIVVIIVVAATLAACGDDDASSTAALVEMWHEMPPDDQAWMCGLTDAERFDVLDEIESNVGNEDGQLTNDDALAALGILCS